MQELSNSAWACATLSGDHSPLLDSIAASASRSLQSELSHAIQKSMGRLQGDLEAALMFEVNIGELAWSFTFISQGDRPLLRAVRDAQLQIGRAFDRNNALWDAHPGVRHPLPLIPPEGVEPPSIAYHLRGICLVLKPPGWEVDTEGDSGLRHLSGFLQVALPLDKRAVALRPDFGFGFIHRLDTPSSGLILTATTFEGYCCLEWQMYTYTIGREYFVLGHGITKVPHLDVVERILDTKTAVVSPHGRPAQSHIRFLANIGRGPRPSVANGFCAVAISILTGRRHQIRVHMRHSKCSSVADHRYSPGPEVFLAPEFCSRI